MASKTDPEDRLLNTAEIEMVAQSRLPIVSGLSREELQALGKRLREARDRSRTIARRQQREMRGKAEPRGATPAAENDGSLGKTEVLVTALSRVTVALRALTKRSQAEIGRILLQKKRAADVPQHPGAGRTASKGMTAKTSKQPSVRMDPREVGRVSKATKVAQAKRDR
jgi:hypothetical protein